MTTIKLQLADLERHLREVAEVAGKESDWNGPQPWTSLRFLQGKTGATRVIFTPKLRGLHIDCSDENVTRGCGFLELGGPIDDDYAYHVTHEAERLSVPILFVGDLDPIDLTGFLALAVRTQNPLGA